MFAGAVTNGEVSVASLGPFLDVDVTGPISLTLEIGELGWVVFVELRMLLTG